MGHEGSITGLVIAGLLGLAGWPCSATADRLVLADGTVVEGVILYLEPRGYVLALQDGDEKLVLHGDITEVYADHPIAPSRPDVEPLPSRPDPAGEPVVGPPRSPRVVPPFSAVPASSPPERTFIAVEAAEADVPVKLEGSADPSRTPLAPLRAFWAEHPDPVDISVEILGIRGLGARIELATPTPGASSVGLRVGAAIEASSYFDGLLQPLISPRGDRFALWVAPVVDFPMGPLELSVTAGWSRHFTYEGYSGLAAGLALRWEREGWLGLQAGALLLSDTCLREPLGVVDVGPTFTW